MSQIQIPTLIIYVHLGLIGFSNLSWQSVEDEEDPNHGEKYWIVQVYQKMYSD